MDIDVLSIAIVGTNTIDTDDIIWLTPEVEGMFFF